MSAENEGGPLPRPWLKLVRYASVGALIAGLLGLFVALDRFFKARSEEVPGDILGFMIGCYVLLTASLLVTAVGLVLRSRWPKAYRTCKQAAGACLLVGLAAGLATEAVCDFEEGKTDVSRGWHAGSWMLGASSGLLLLGLLAAQADGTASEPEARRHNTLEEGRHAMGGVEDAAPNNSTASSGWDQWATGPANDIQTAVRSAWSAWPMESSRSAGRGSLTEPLFPPYSSSWPHAAGASNANGVAAAGSASSVEDSAQASSRTLANSVGNGSPGHNRGPVSPSNSVGVAPSQQAAQEACSVAKTGGSTTFGVGRGGGSPSGAGSFANVNSGSVGSGCSTSLATPAPRARWDTPPARWDTPPGSENRMRTSTPPAVLAQ
eukprot:TRINITY_DN38553_c0_g1_i1.p1 TRINITY_DN38553_c0_g1~~TRINITY_DN38553_c0_g1_i1.p1  ORF type:complete len:378 (-),score=63.60 TRINITY_DN38553_c0_g1_i1:176-1309(-)